MSARARPVTGVALVASLARMRKSFVLEHERLFRQHGDLLWLGKPAGYYLTFHPADVRHVLRDNARAYRKSSTYQALAPLLGQGLILAEGDTWREHRRIVAREFTPQRVREHVPVVVDLTARWLHRLSRQEQTLALDPEITALVFEIAANVLFGSSDARVAESVGQGLSAYLEGFVSRAYSLFQPPMWVPTPTHRKMHGAVRQLDAALATVLSRARDSDGDDSNVLRRLRAASQDDRLDERALRDELITLLMAGHETTANALLWCLLLLAQNPKCQDRVAEEVRGVTGGQAPSAAQVDQLAYTEMCVRESLRLFPPVPGFSRDALEADELRGEPFPAGTRVEVSTWVTHRHPEYWTEPQRFQPERFASGWRKRIEPLSYFPFGGGPRTCIGEELSRVQLVAMLAMIVDAFQLRCAGPPPTPFPTVTLRPWPGLTLRLRRRG